MINFMTAGEAAARVGVTESYVLQLGRANRFPQIVRIGPGLKGPAHFIESEVKAWLRHRKESPPRRGRPKGPEKPKPPTAQEVRDREGLARLLVCLECKVESLEAKVSALEGTA